jgi:hypothetical protein
MPSTYGRPLLYLYQYKVQGTRGTEVQYVHILFVYKLYRLGSLSPSLNLNQAMKVEIALTSHK